MYNKANILVIRFSSIGDIILTTPILRALKQQLNANITFLTKSKYQNVLAHNPYINQIQVIEDFEIVSNQFDLIIDLQKNPKSTLFASKYKASKITFNKLNIKKWFLVNFKIDLIGSQHLVERYFDALKDIGIVNDQKGLDYFTGENSLSKFDLPQNYSVINCGGTYYTKRLPYEKVMEIVKISDVPMVLLGGEDVSEAYQDLPPHLSVLNLIDKTNLNQSALIIAKCNRMFTSDSALMHIGAALGVDLTVFWGNTSPKFGMFPYDTSDADIVNKIPTNLSCHPCSKLGFDICPKGHFKCMRQHEVK